MQNIFKCTSINNIMSSRGRYFKAVCKTFKNKQNGLEPRIIYESVDKQINEKGKWWHKTVRNVLNKCPEFERNGDKWFFVK